MMVERIRAKEETLGDMIKKRQKIEKRPFGQGGRCPGPGRDGEVDSGQGGNSWYTDLQTILKITPDQTNSKIICTLD